MASEIYIAVAVIILAALALLLYKNRGRKEKRLSRLAALAFAFVIAGIVFGDDQLLRYGLLAVGVVLAVIDIAMQMRKK